MPSPRLHSWGGFTMAMQHSCISPQSANRPKPFSCFHPKHFPKVAGETKLRHAVSPVLFAFNATCVLIPLIMIKSTCISLYLCGNHNAEWFCMVNECVMCKPSQFLKAQNLGGEFLRWFPRFSCEFMKNVPRAR